MIFDFLHTVLRTSYPVPQRDGFFGRYRSFRMTLEDVCGGKSVQKLKCSRLKGGEKEDGYFAQGSV